MIKLNTLRGRISILLLISLTGITILIGSISFFSTRSNFRTILEERAATIIEAVGPTLELGLYAENLALLEPPIKGLLAQRDIIYSSAYNLSGFNLIRRSEIDFDFELDKKLLEKVKQGEFISQLRKIQGQSFLDCIGPVYPLEITGQKEPIGILRLGISLAVISSAMQRLTLILSISLIAALLIVSLVTTRMLIMLFRPLYDLKENLKQISEGKVNLGVRLSEDTLTTETNELASSFNRFVQSMQENRDFTKEVSERMSAQAEELAASSEQMSASYEEISSTMQQVALASDKQAAESQTASEMAQKALRVVRQSLDSAQETLKSSDTISLLSQKGEESAKEVRLAMDNVTNITHELEGVIQQIQKRSEEISNIIETVSEISKRTNVLSLNATIEASKAGESGRGFAVVAEEVRKLATQSAESARKISEILGEITSVIDSLIIKTQETIKEVNHGKETSLKSADFLKNIADEISHITKRIKEITIINKQGEEEVNTINEAIENIAAIAEENAASSEEVSAAIQQLSASIQELSATSQETAQIAENLLKLTRE
ncbi:MAG: methyl-accepting chemotaxis protein [Candidatus Stahlbacteria bacterium]|nr:MAG: methyl-accepting chemotaxis protein [Candidatus Stahlbacteria bacterium]